MRGTALSEKALLLMNDNEILRTTIAFPGTISLKNLDLKKFSFLNVFSY